MTHIFQRLDQTARRPYSTQEYIRRILWNWTRAILIRPSPRMANRWRRFWARRFGARIDSSSGFKSSTRIFHPWLLTVGRHCTLAEGVTVYNLGPIVIGDHTVLSQDVYLCAGTHDYAKPDLPLLRPAITIGNGVWICAGAFIGPGVKIGDNSIVGARAVVMSDVPSGVIVAGNPARVIKARPIG
ncbi:MAG TPA: hypothetical protein VG326_17810 [Tepidisphaeraceae bacterium]|jgi:putative colanic acid biosynthesis acetyltransferase WcaF|nr:hypothetical protein [Tepidisphaeraceae bacterium]